MNERIRSRRSRSRVDRVASTRRWGPAIFVLVVGTLGTVATLGCRTYHNLPETIGNDTNAIDAIMIEVDRGLEPSSYPDVGLPPLTIRDPAALDAATYRDITLEETIRTALSHASVLRDLRARVLRAPRSVVTEETIPLAQTNPQFGVEGALAAYDAQFYAFGKWQNNDRRFNNVFFGGGSTAFKQDTHDYVFQMSKRTPTGAQFAVRSVTDYDANNATGNLTDSAWQIAVACGSSATVIAGGRTILQPDRGSGCPAWCLQRGPDRKGEH